MMIKRFLCKLIGCSPPPGVYDAWSFRWECKRCHTVRDGALLRAKEREEIRRRLGLRARR